MRARAKSTAMPLRGVECIFGIASDIADTLTLAVMRHEVVVGAHRATSGEVQVHFIEERTLEVCTLHSDRHLLA